MRDEPKDRSRRTEPRKGVDKILGNRGEEATEEYSRDKRETKEAPSDQPLDRKTRRMTEQKTHKENTAMRYSSLCTKPEDRSEIQTARTQETHHPAQQIR